jgi:hypothetical protein
MISSANFIIGRWCPDLKMERESVTRRGLIGNATGCGSQSRAPKSGHQSLTAG